MRSLKMAGFAFAVARVHRRRDVRRDQRRRRALMLVTVYPAGAQVTRVGAPGEEGRRARDPVHRSARTGRDGLDPGRRQGDGRTAKLVRSTRGAFRCPAPTRRSRPPSASRIEDGDREAERMSALVLQATVEAALGPEDAGQQPGANTDTDALASHAAAQQPDWSQLFALIGQRVTEAQKTILEAQIKMRETDRQIAQSPRASFRHWRPLPSSAPRSRCSSMRLGALDADLIIRYQVGTASWTPFYDARLATGTRDQAPRLQLTRRASNPATNRRELG